jgi:hypothetical protein
MRLQSILSISVLFILLTSAGVGAQWQPDGVPISAAPDDRYYPQVVADGSGGAIMTWMDFRNGANFDIYAQRVDASGVTQWAVDGTPICTSANDQYSPYIVPDGSGGAIVVWTDYRSGPNGDVWAQRVNASGVAQWMPNGVPVCTYTEAQSAGGAVPDGSGGAIVVWVDYRNSVDGDIYAQRVDAAGGTLWLFNGIVVCDFTGLQRDLQIVSDGSGGAIIAWEDFRSGSSLDVYTQRVNASGVVQWTADGVAVSTAVYNQEDPQVVSDSSGGAIVTWEDFRTEITVPNIYAQRVDASGLVRWTADGVAVCTEVQDQTDPAIVSDGSGGAFITWHDPRSGAAYEIYAQRVNASGVTLWTKDGVAVTNAGENQTYPALVSDGSGGAMITWRGYNYSQSRPGTDIYAQRLSASGIAQWDTNGVVLCSAAYNQRDHTMVSDGAGGAIVTWQDERSGNKHIYAQRFESRYGYWGHPEPVVTSIADVPGDQGGTVKVNWTASGLDALDYRTITHYSIWRATDPVAAASAIAKDPSLVVAPSDVTAGFSGRAFRIERTATVDYYWELVGSQVAQYFAGYAYSAATTADSTSQGTMEHFFQVLSHTSDVFVFWPSNAMSGHSVDNLAPAPPLQLTAQRVGPDVHLQWNRVTVGDLRDYAVYRTTAPGVTPVPVNFLLSSVDTVTVDPSPPTGSLYYIVTAYDVHENQSAPSNEASVTGATGIDDTPPIAALTVLQNHPNPFTGTTELGIGLPAPSGVSIELFDVAGRRVNVIKLPAGSAGWQRVPFAGVDDSGRPLASGVYFYRVTANGATVTRKMVIAR